MIYSSHGIDKFDTIYPPLHQPQCRLMLYLGALLGLLLGLLDADELVPVQGDESVHRTPVSGRLLKLLADLSIVTK
jgi:hypothetical protein